MVATLICLVTSQVISYIKARAEASGLRGDGGLIERPERLIIVLVGAGLSGLPFFHVPWLLHVAMWVLAVASLVTMRAAAARGADLARRDGADCTSRDGAAETGRPADEASEP